MNIEVEAKEVEVEETEQQNELQKRKEVFEDMGKDPKYPCKTCKRCEKPMECRLLCKIWREWFTCHWRGIQKVGRSFRKT